MNPTGPGSNPFDLSPWTMFGGPPDSDVGIFEPSARGPAFDPFVWVRLFDGFCWALPRVEGHRIGEFPRGVAHRTADLMTCPKVPVPAPGMFATWPPTEAEVAAFNAGAEAVDEMRRRTRALMVELLLVNYQIMRRTAEALVGGPDADDSLEPSWWDPWMDAIGPAIEGAGPEAMALVIARGVPISLN